MKGCGGRVVVQDGAGQLAVEAVDVASEFREAQIDQAMQLAHAIAEVLQQPLAQVHQLAQLLGYGVGNASARRPFLRCEPGDAKRVDGVGLGALEILGGEAMGAQRIDQGHGKTSRGQRGEEVLPVMTGGLHGDQHIAGRAEQIEQLAIALGILGKGAGLDENFTVLADHRDHVGLGGDVHSSKAHMPSCRRRKSGASEPVLRSLLVHAGTRPRDTVRTLSTGRGRQSHCRGRSLERATAILSRIPSVSILLGVAR